MSAPHIDIIIAQFSLRHGGAVCGTRRNRRQISNQEVLNRVYDVPTFDLPASDDG